jgi:hypothetical protein
MPASTPSNSIDPAPKLFKRDGNSTKDNHTTSFPNSAASHTLKPLNEFNTWRPITPETQEQDRPERSVRFQQQATSDAAQMSSSTRLWSTHMMVTAMKLIPFLRETCLGRSLTFAMVSSNLSSTFLNNFLLFSLTQETSGGH